MRFLLILSLLFFSAIMDVSGNDKKREIDLLEVQYSAVSYESLSSLMWKLGNLDASNNNMIDDYMAVTNCPLYAAYFKNDFFWQRIRNGIKRQLSYYSSQFPDRFEIVSAIDLGRYDFQTASFVLPDDSKLSNVSYFTLARTNSMGLSCGREVEQLPKVYTSVMNKPINLTSIPVDSGVARTIIEKSANSKNPNKRMAVLRLRMKLLGVKSAQPKKIKLFTETAFRTEIDDITIFDSSKMNKVLWKQTFKNLEK